jgi:hypothetical protein
MIGQIEQATRREHWEVRSLIHVTAEMNRTGVGS